MIAAEDGAEATSITRARIGWKKFNETISFLTMRGLPLHMKGRLYMSCVRSAVMYGT